MLKPDLLVVVILRSSPALTAAAVNGVPSEKTSPERTVMSIVDGLTTVTSEARSGTKVPLGVSRKRPP